MTKSLIFTSAASADIDRIYDYTEDRWGHEQAEAYTFGLRDLSRMLTSGQRRGGPIRGVKAGYLALTYKFHFVIYRETDRQITVVRILHRRMNISNHL